MIKRSKKELHRVLQLELEQMNRHSNVLTKSQ